MTGSGGRLPLGWAVGPSLRSMLRSAVLILAGGALAACEQPRGFLKGDPLASVRQAPATPPIQSPPTPGEIAEIRTRDAQRAAQGFVRRSTATRPLLRDRPPVSGTQGEEITLNLDGADLPSVVRVMIQDGLGANYVLDPAVTGTVTLKTNRPLRPDEILPTLEEILRLNNAALIERDGVFRIIPRAQAGLSAPLLSARDAFSRGLTNRVTPLRYVTVDDIAEVLESFSPVAGAIRYDRANNLVFTTASQAEQRTISNLIASLDVNQFAGRSFALTPLNEASAALVVQEMTALFEPVVGRANPAIRFLPIDRINAVLTISSQESLLNDALAFLGSLDQSYGDTVKVHTYPVTNRRASDLGLLLGQIFDASVAGAQPQTNALSPLGTSETTQTAQTDAPEEAPLPDPATVQAISGVSGAGRAGVRSIVADDASNTLIALANDAGSRAIRRALRQLDQQPLQVLIEATLIEVALNDTLEYGVRWFLQNGNFSVNFGDALGAGANAIFPGFNTSFVTGDVSVTLSALDAITDVRVLSAPSLMVLDNQQARLQVGDQVPVTVRSSTSTLDPAAPLVAETEFRDTGVILELSPSVSSGGLVVMGIKQEISDVSNQSQAGNPTFSQRVIESTVAVQNGQTIALAGLIQEDASFGREGLPLISRIPVLGSAFGTTAESVGRTELLVLIRPLVVRDQSDAQAATDELRRKLLSLREPVVPQGTE